MLERVTALYEDVQKSIFHILTPEQIMYELREFIENVEVTNCIFRSNHASNYIALSGTLPQDKNLLLRDIDFALKGEHKYKKEDYRQL